MADYGGDPIVKPAAGAYGGDPVVKPAPAPDTGLGVYWQHFKEDLARRSAGAGAITAPINAGDFGAGFLDADGRPTVPAVDIIGATPRLQALGAQIMAAPLALADQFVDRPARAAIGQVQDATGIAPGYEVRPGAVTDIASVAVPIAGEAMTEAQIAKAADAAGISRQAYATARAQGRAAANAAAARRAADAAAAKPVKPPGPIAQAIAPITAAVSQPAAEAQAGAKLAAGATDPAAVRASLADTGEIVPGSQPTTFQQTGDMGIGAMERTARTADPGPYQERAAAQNEARVNAMPAPGGNIDDVGAALRGHLDAIDTQTEADVNAAAAKASRANDALGPEATPEESGAAIRTAISDAERAGRARTSAMYTELGLDDPAVTANVGATRGAAGDILSGQATTARPPEGEEAAIFAAANAMKPVSPMRDLLELRSRVGAELRRQRAPGGDPASVRRLSRLQAAIDDNLDTTIADGIEAEQAAAASGQVQAGDALATRLSSSADALGQRTEARAAAGGDTVALPARGPAPNGGPAGAGIPPEGGPGGPAGDQGLPGEQPTVSPDVVPTLRDANAAYKAERQTFGADPVDNVLAQDKNGGYAVLNGDVPKAIFRPGPGSFERVQNAIKAGGDRAQQAIEDYAAKSLRSAAQRSDGTIDPDKFAKWSDAHRDALRALPEATRARLADAASAGRAVDEAAANRAAALKAANEGVLGKLIGADPADVPRIVGAIFNRADSVAQMKALVARVRNNPAALAGLRQAVADHITTNFVGNTEAATSGVAQIKADAFQSFVRKNSGALRQVFSNDEMANLHAIAADIQRAKRSENALRLPGGSNTAQDGHALSKAEQTAKTNHSKSMLDLIGAALGGLLGSHGGPMAAIEGSALGGSAAHVLQTTIEGMQAKGIARVDQLVNRALLDPGLARSLLAKAPVHRPGTTAVETGWVVRSKAIQRALAAGAASDADQN